MVGRAKSEVQFAAEQMRASLAARLRTGAQHSLANTGLLNAMKLCDLFLNSKVDTKAALEVLKQEVKAVVNKSAAQAVPTAMKRTSTKQRSSELDAMLDHTTGPQASMLQSQLSTSRGSAARATDGLPLPIHLLEQKAHVKGGDYDRLVMVQDENGRRELQDEERKRHQAVTSTRALLDQQMEEVRAKKVAEQQAKAAEAVQLQKSILQHQREELARMQKERELAQQRHHTFTQQVEEARAARQEAAERAMRESLAERKALEEQERKEAARQAQAKAEAAAKLRAFQAEQEAQVQLKAAEAAARQLEERRYNKEYSAMLEAREAKRLADLEQVKEKQRRKFEAGGGIALQKGLEEQARQDAQRAKRQEQEYEAKQAALRAQKELERKQRLDELNRIREQQMAEKRATQQAEQQEKERVRQQMQQQLAELKAQEAAAKAASKTQQRSTLRELKAAVAQEAEKRFGEFAGYMTAEEKKVHARVLSAGGKGTAVHA